MIIHLNESEIEFCRRLSDQKRADAIKYGLKDNYNFIKRSDYNRAVNNISFKTETEDRGLKGEYVVAKALNLIDNWNYKLANPLIGEKKKPDILGRAGVIYEVRTPNKSYGKLIVREQDRYDAHYILVTELSLYTYRIVGWIMGIVAMQECYWSAPDPKRKPCWAVPQNKLFDFQSLIDEELRVDKQSE